MAQSPRAAEQPWESGIKKMTTIPHTIERQNLVPGARITAKGSNPNIPTLLREPKGKSSEGKEEKKTAPSSMELAEQPCEELQLGPRHQENQVNQQTRAEPDKH